MLVNHAHMKLGKHAPVHNHHLPMLSSYTKGLPIAPDSVDYSHIPNLGMMMNDKIGDCTCAAVGHIIQQWGTYTHKPLVPTDQQVLSLYEAVSGYNPKDPSTDNGAVETDVLNYWVKNKAFGISLDAYAPLELGNHNEVKDAVYWFGNAYIGLNLPISAQTQDVWSVPAGGTHGNGAPGSWGGHAVPVVAYNARTLTVITWGALKQMTWAFWAAYAEEAYALLSTDWISSGKSPKGISWTTLQADFKEVVAIK